MLLALQPLWRRENISQSLDKPMLADLRKRFGILIDAKQPREKRVFAGMELFCFPVSLITLALLPVLCLNRFWWHVQLPSIIDVAVKILVAAATGYITNFIAVEMLFKPYNRSRRHLFSWITCGYWSQGLIPRNKDNLGLQLGKEAELLVPPEKIASDLCGMAKRFLESKENITRVEVWLRKYLLSKEKVIVDACGPWLIDVCEHKLRDALTIEDVKTFVQGAVLPRLRSRESLSVLVKQLQCYVSEKVPSVIPLIKEEVRGCIYNQLKKNEKAQILSSVVSALVDDPEKILADKIVDSEIDWGDVESRLNIKLQDEELASSVLHELDKLVGCLETWMDTPAGKAKLGQFAGVVVEECVKRVRKFVEDDLGKLISGVIRSEGTWSIVTDQLIPAIRPQVLVWLQGEGKDVILNKLNISGRMAEAVEKLSVEEFHERVNQIAAQHLGAIQVLGYILGAFVGIGLLFV